LAQRPRTDIQGGHSGRRATTMATVPDHGRGLTEPIGDDTAHEAFASVNSIILSSSLLALMVIGYRIHTQHLKHIPESVVAIALGFFVGVIVRIVGIRQEEQLLGGRFGELFFYVLLPPIIFHEGLSLDTQIFVDNLGAIITYAVGGTVVSTWFVSQGMRFAAYTGLVGLANTERIAIYCHLFGASMSATDPVATISLFGSARFRSDPLLHSIINGESVLNDAVAIVLFGTLSRHLDGDTPELLSMAILGHFALVCVGSVFVGGAAGALCSWCFRRSLHLTRFPDYEISFMCLGAYLTYAVSQLLSLSGVVALFFFGAMLSQYNWYNLSEPSKVASKVIFGTLAKLAELCVFIYLGVIAALSLGRLHWHIGMVVCSLPIIMAARAAHVFPFSFLLNLGRHRKIDCNMRIMMWASGLRGAVAFALSLRIPCSSSWHDRRGSSECRNSDLFVTTTISIIMLTMLGVGTMIERIATSLHVVEPEQLDSIERQLICPHDPLQVPLASRPRGSGNDSAGSPPPSPLDREAAAHSVVSSPPLESYGGPPVPPEHGGGPEVPPSRPAGGARSLWSQRFSAKGELYQAFARFDLDVLQPALGGPCRAPSLAMGCRSDHAFYEMQGYSDHLLVEDEAPAWSRSVVFE